MLKIALSQWTGHLDPQDNLKVLERDMSAIRGQASMLFVPEVFWSYGAGSGNSQVLTTEGEKQLCELCAKYEIHLVGGSSAVERDGKIFNEAIVIDKTGQVKARYLKRHLFSCDMIDKNGKHVQLDEGARYSSGNKAVVVELEGVRIGLGLCFDLRFPEFYREYRRLGCQIVTGASAFTKATGDLHWHLVNRARAIDNQFFVVSAGQVGIHENGTQTYGHSLVVNPMGEVIADLGEAPNVQVVEIDVAEIVKARDSIHLDRYIP